MRIEKNFNIKFSVFLNYNIFTRTICMSQTWTRHSSKNKLFSISPTIISSIYEALRLTLLYTILFFAAYGIIKKNIHLYIKIFYTCLFIASNRILQRAFNLYIFVFRHVANGCISNRKKKTKTKSKQVWCENCIARCTALFSL